ncbi:MAG: endonuclease/exonuclease/phosphatase family protein [Planctomycetes bacterium]|nr:endonuclease/exonuclease/phosphatase family protein [Planctomycetota bacterium]
MAVIALVFVSLSCEAGDSQAEDGSAERVRFATFNSSLHRQQAGELVQNLKAGDDRQAQRIAEIIQTVRPDVLLMNEFDYDEQGEACRQFREKYLAIEHNGKKPIEYPFFFVAPVNTGVPSGLDFNRDGKTDGPEDAFGFGRYPGQYGMVLFSKFPIERDAVRTFQKFLWTDMPGAELPKDPQTGQPYYEKQVLSRFRLSSKSHWDIPISIGGKRIHVLAAHPTPPAFDGPEHRNRLRNHDEIRLWADYLSPAKSGYLYDDKGQRGGLDGRAEFVILGDYNADPLDGTSHDRAILQLLEHPRVRKSSPPTSRGGVEASTENPKQNSNHNGKPENDTAFFSSPNGPGNLRIDYVLVSKGLEPVGSGVFWPKKDEPGAELVTASDHRLVYVDLAISSGNE